MKFARVLAILSIAAVLAGCATQNKYEREAEKITRAVMNNDLGPVKNDIAPDAKISRVQVAAWADELDAQGKLLSLKERPTCDAGPGVHCFDVKFEKHNYVEQMLMDDQGKVVRWNFHMANAS